jgi:hypothetical protein
MKHLHLLYLKIYQDLQPYIQSLTSTVFTPLNAMFSILFANFQLQVTYATFFTAP